MVDNDVQCALEAVSTADVAGRFGSHRGGGYVDPR